jgi:hypothetical protein
MKRRLPGLAAWCAAGMPALVQPAIAAGLPAHEFSDANWVGIGGLPGVIGNISAIVTERTSQ